MISFQRHIRWMMFTNSKHKRKDETTKLGGGKKTNYYENNGTNNFYRFMKFIMLVYKIVPKNAPWEIENLVKTIFSWAGPLKERIFLMRDTQQIFKFEYKRHKGKLDPMENWPDMQASDTISWLVSNNKDAPMEDYKACCNGVINCQHEVYSALCWSAGP